MVEHLAYNEGVSGSSPLLSTLLYLFFVFFARMVKLVYTLVLGASPVRGMGSSPFSGN